MDDSELQDSCYLHHGVPVTPQARKLGYEFPVFVSQVVWAEACLWNGAGRFETSVDRRIIELIQACYEGMLKKLTQTDAFLFYYFKHWIWKRYAGAETKKKKRVRYGARLFIDEDGMPWLYIFNPKRDDGHELTKGELREDPESDDSTDPVSEPDDQCTTVDIPDSSEDQLHPGTDV
jgi:hypothetical protein